MIFFEKIIHISDLDHYTYKICPKRKSIFQKQIYCLTT